MLTFPPDFSFVIQIFSFLILWFGLKRLLFDPMVHVLEQREARTIGAHEAAAEMNESAQRSATDYERVMQDLRVTLAAEMQSSRATTQAEERKVLDEARTQATAQLAQLRDSLGRQAQTARAGLDAEARNLAEQMVERIVGRPLP